MGTVIMKASSIMRPSHQNIKTRTTVLRSKAPRQAVNLPHIAKMRASLAVCAGASIWFWLDPQVRTSWWSCSGCSWTRAPACEPPCCSVGRSAPPAGSSFPLPCLLSSHDSWGRAGSGVTSLEPWTPRAVWILGSSWESPPQSRKSGTQNCSGGTSRYTSSWISE